ncbi:hypothetical protein BMETH_2022_1 [methanotrophic bacterial endosymbiont of Bathymodiolus sp.]|nr:hypothetical protein BMETH_2022_1 [methanotrophic bacterial endosymbiont of Bathymodiolus sp.]
MAHLRASLEMQRLFIKLSKPILMCRCKLAVEYAMKIRYRAI